MFLFSLLGARGGVGFVADLEECRYCEAGWFDRWFVCFA